MIYYEIISKDADNRTILLKFAQKPSHYDVSDFNEYLNREHENDTTECGDYLLIECGEFQKFSELYELVENHLNG